MNFEATNFIEEIIIDDLKSGRTKSIATRFPPEPNGYLHIGHAKAICLNFGLAKKFKGTCNLRFDDTNPEKEEDEYCRAIIEDIKWLGFEGKILYSSDYFDFMYDCAVKLIKKGLAYVCELDSEQVRLYRGTLTEAGKESPYRNRDIKENLQLFERMKKGEFADGTLTLRAKIDMSSPNVNMRDPVIYRVLHSHHHRQKDKWCIYPMYDFAHPLEDAYEKITHSVCTLEFEGHRPLYDWVLKECEIPSPPRQYEFARLNLTRTVMSKRYLKKLVDSNIVDSWDDPRMPTLAGLRRRGYPAEAIRDFCETIGVSKSNSEVDYGLLEHCVRNRLNESAHRVMAVLDPIKLVITDYEGSEMLSLENHPFCENSGNRAVSFSNELYIERSDFAPIPPPKYHRLTEGGIVRLKGAYIVKCESYETDSDGNVTVIYCTHVKNSKSGLDTSGLKPKGVIHWVNAKDCIDITVNRLDFLLLDDGGEGKDFDERINPNSKTIIKAKAEKSLQNAEMLKPYQFMRQSYFARDPKFDSKIVFNEIVGLKDSYKL